MQKEKENMGKRNLNIKTEDKLAKIHCPVRLKKQLKMCVDTLKFYANLQNYNVESGAITDMKPRGLSKKLWKVLDFGDRANQTLEEMKKVI